MRHPHPQTSCTWMQGNSKLHIPKSLRSTQDRSAWKFLGANFGIQIKGSETVRDKLGNFLGVGPISWVWRVLLTCMRSSLPNQTWSRECTWQIANAAKANTFLSMHCTNRPQTFQISTKALLCGCHPNFPLFKQGRCQILLGRDEGSAVPLFCCRVLRPKGTASCTSSSSSLNRHSYAICHSRKEC